MDESKSSFGPNVSQEKAHGIRGYNLGTRLKIDAGGFNRTTSGCPFAPKGTTNLHYALQCLATLITYVLLVGTSWAQNAGGSSVASPLIALENEAPARLIVDPPLPGPLAQGRVFIRYRTENLRVMPVFGKGALDVSPRLGHVHITVDDAPWHFVDASGETIILVGLPPGPHHLLIELADPTHKVITAKTVRFTVPNFRKASDRTEKSSGTSALCGN